MGAEKGNRLLELMRRHDKAIWRRCLRYTIGDASWAADLEQEVMLRIWQNLGTLTASPYSKAEKVWVMKVTESVLVNVTRGKHVTLDSLKAEVADSDDEIARKREVLEELGAYLPEQDKMLLDLLLAGYDNDDIARMLALTHDAVSVRVYRMVAKMRDIHNKLYNKRP